MPAPEKRNFRSMKEITYDETPNVKQSNTIGEAWSNLVRNPSLFIRYWNYKGAVMSGVVRAPIFLITYLVGRESLRLALGAAFVQFVFRFLIAGIGGTLIQAFRRVEPAWKALLTILFIVPIISHFFEFLVQFSFAYLTGTNDHTDEAIVRSICFSIFSALFTLFIMRRNVLIVGDSESKSLLSDIAKLPFLIFEFTMFIPVEIALIIRRGAYLTAIACILAFGVFSQMLCLAFTNKFYWTYSKGKEIAYLKYWGVDGIILITIVIGFALIYFARKDKRNRTE